MADSDQAQLPPAALRQANFEQSVAYSLHLWPALTLSVQNNWGGPDSADKRDWFAGAIVELFPEFTDNDSNASDPSAKNGNSSSSNSKVSEEPDQEYLETFLLQVMVDEFEVNVDDDSGVEAAEQIMRARAQCAEGQFDEYNTLRERFANRKGKKVDALFKKVEDANQDTDWETDDSGDDDGDDDDDDDEAGGDTQMRDAPPPREKAPPEVDEDGFTKVTRKR